MYTRTKILAASLSSLALAQPVGAAEWQHEIAPYLWGSAMSGTTGIGDVTAEADLSFSDILDDLEFGFMGAYRASRDRHSIMVDAIYMGLGATERGPNGRLKADIDVDQVALEADFGYALSEALTVLAGLRYMDLDAEVQVTGPLGNEVSASTQESWVDPVVGGVYRWGFSEQWSATLRGDVGGFGIGSDFSWQGLATLRWQVSPRTGVLFAYRYIDVDYEDGDGQDRFKYDMAISGPAMGVVFTF